MRRDPVEEINAEIAARFRTDPRHPLRAWGPGHVSLGARFVDIAADLHRRYGDALTIAVGGRAYPPDRIVVSPPSPLHHDDREGAPLPPGAAPPPFSFNLSSQSVVAGDDLTGSLAVSNPGRAVIQLNYGGGTLFGGVRAPGADPWAATTEPGRPS